MVTFFELFYTPLRQITCLPVGWWNIDDMVKPARSEQSTVQTVRSVCRSYNHHIIVANFLVVQLSSIKKDDPITAYWSVVAFAWKWGRVTFQEFLTMSWVWLSSAPSVWRIFSVPLLSSVFRPTPSISFKSTDRRRVCALLAVWLDDREPMRESISSRNRIQGVQARAWRNSCIRKDS